MNSKRFIDYLDSYNKKTQYNYIHYSLLTGAIQSNYIENNLNDISFVGNVNIKNPEKTQPVFLHFYPILENPIIESSNNNYYSKFSHSNWNNSNINDLETQYSIWQKEHETSIYIPSLPPMPVKKKSKNIDTSINNLTDIINIIKENEYNDETEYNIDLKSLHNIKDELIELNNMIGMEKIKQSILDQLIYFIQELHIGKGTSDFKHTVIYGPPGTGKTEIAKIIGKMY